MSRIYVLASLPGAGKTTTALLLERHFLGQDLRVACLQQNKGQSDVHTYLSAGCCHYTVPLEATKSREAFERWAPRGYDVLIMEVTYPYTPFGAPYLIPFDAFNEVVPFEARADWKSFVFTKTLGYWKEYPSDTNFDPTELWDTVHDRTVQTIVTKIPSPLDGPCVDTGRVLHHPERFVCDTVEPRMTLPKSDRAVIAVGAFPGEYREIFPNLTWYRFDYASFLQEFRTGTYDVAIIGMCLNERLKFRDRPERPSIICYQPSVYCDLEKHPKNLPLKDNFGSILSAIRERAVGEPIVPEGSAYSEYNNRFWTYRPYPEREMIWREENVVFCNGWVLPQYLIREGFLEAA
ncbi:hypothetical protein [Methanoculleus chikugoensis]|uniref:Uncharacterized protein n=1 Tax=Methanoculleus chikugoensis TaxID=118126 RepID=A0ABN5XNV8_9EURY|nr:hypothetical protein [Methanoculleus chikugoensis]BBL68900.1 hypothetical protein MchiMG62_20810 [Methanoculleus chikugoensis]